MDYNKFLKKLFKWQTTTFPNANKNGILEHLKREVEELAEHHSPHEAADIFILLLEHSNLCGYNLLQESVRKLEINKKRKWKEPDEYGVIEHIKE